MMSGFVTAVRTLTILPVAGRDASSMAMALPWFPVVGALLGAMLFGSGLLFELIFPTWHMLIAIWLLFAQTTLTGAMHLDGVADAGDALFSMTDREKKLDIMKDSRLGTFGVLSLIFVLTAKGVLLVRLIDAQQMALLVVVMSISRAAQVTLAVSMPYARKEAGTARGFVESASRWHLMLAWLISVLLVSMFGPLAMLAVFVALGGTLGLRQFFHLRIGGITGDLLGAANECIEILLLLWLCGWVDNDIWIQWSDVIFEVFN